MSKNAIVFKAVLIVNLLYYVNLDLKIFLVRCQQNVIECGKTELVIFKHQRKKVDSPIKIKLNCKRFYASKSAKYLHIKIKENFNWKQHIHDIAIKLHYL